MPDKTRQRARAKKSPPPIALLTVRRVAAMSPREVRQLGDWLTAQGAWLREHHAACADVMRMRLLA